MFLAIGLVTIAVAVPAVTASTAARMAASAAGALDESGRPGSAVTVTPMSTTGSAVGKAATRRCRVDHGERNVRREASARRATNFGSASR